MHYTGQPLKRFEDAYLVTGKGSFVDDMQLPDMLHDAEGDRHDAATSAR